MDFTLVLSTFLTKNKEVASLFLWKFKESISLHFYVLKDFVSSLHHSSFSRGTKGV